jgi:uncharacterized protein (DUF2384 family)
MPIDPKRVAGACYGGQISALIEVLSGLYTPRDALAWLVAPQPLLDGRVPADMLANETDAAKVIAVVDQLTDGVHV